MKRSRAEHRGGSYKRVELGGFSNLDKRQQIQKKPQENRQPIDIIIRPNGLVLFCAVTTLIASICVAIFLVYPELSNYMDLKHDHNLSELVGSSVFCIFLFMLSVLIVLYWKNNLLRVTETRIISKTIIGSGKQYQISDIRRVDCDTKYYKGREYKVLTIHLKQNKKLAFDSLATKNFFELMEFMLSLSVTKKIT